MLPIENWMYDEVEGPDTSDKIHRQVYLQGFAKPLLGTLLPRSYQTFFLDVTCYGIASPTHYYTATPSSTKVIF